MSLCLRGFFFFSTPRLVTLEVDSEEENTEPKSLLSPLSSDVKKSELKRETFDPSPDLPCSRSQSASSACEPATKVKHRLRLLSNTSVYLTTLMFFLFFYLPCIGIGRPRDSTAFIFLLFKNQFASIFCPRQPCLKYQSWSVTLQVSQKEIQHTTNDIYTS